MTTELKLRRGTTTQHSTFTGAAGEVTIDTTKNTVVVHDGVIAGGIPLAKESQIVSAVASLGYTPYNATNPSGFITNSSNTTGSSGSCTGNAATATTATKITNSGGWSVTPSGTKLYFNYNGTNLASLDSLGNLVTLANITAYGTP